MKMMKHLKNGVLGAFVWVMMKLAAPYTTSPDTANPFNWAMTPRLAVLIIVSVFILSILDFIHESIGLKKIPNKGAKTGMDIQ